MSKKIKELELNDLRKTFKGVRDFVLLQPLKLDSAADYELRRGLRAKKIRVKMVKNSFVKKVFDENGVKVDPGAGPTLLCWGAGSPKELGTAVDANGNLTSTSNYKYPSTVTVSQTTNPSRFIAVRFDSRSTAPPPVARTSRSCPNNSTSAADSRSRNPASPSERKISEIVRPATCSTLSSQSTNRHPSFAASTGPIVVFPAPR